MTTTGHARRTGTGKLATTAAAAALSLLGLAALAGPAAADHDPTHDLTSDQDTTPPTANPMATPPANENGWHQDGVGIEWNWADAESGVSSECEPSGETGGEGSFVVVSECADNAGNIGRAEFALRVDRTPPTVTLDPDTNGGTSLRFSGADQLSGIDHFTCGVGDQPVERCESPLDLSALGAGSHEFTIRAVDAASNLSERAYFTHVVFPDLPSGSITIDGVRFIKKRTGDLSIIGTQGEDAIYIRAGVEPGHVAIGLDSGGFDSLVWAGPVRNISITTKNGDDFVAVRKARLPGNLTLNLGQGGAFVVIGEATIDGRTSIRVGSNRAQTPANVHVADSALNGPVTFIGGRSDDGFFVTDSTIAGRFSIRAGSGTNQVNLVRVDGITRFSYGGGSGRDQFRSSQVDLGSRSSINTDGGDDQIEAFGGIDGLLINSGSGSDSVQVSGGIAEGDNQPAGHVVRVIAGSGNDFVSAGQGLAEASSFDGGAGDDDYTGQESYTLRNFERINPGN